MNAANVTLRNTGWVTAQRGLQIAIGVLFAIVVPRLMGPETFGQYALVTSVSMWFALLSGLGAVSTMTRSVPGFVVRDDWTGLRSLVSQLLGLRAATGLLAAFVYFALTTSWLGIDAVALACIAGAVFTRTTANISFALFLGLNQAARWGMGEVLRRALTLGGVAAGFALGGLRGASAGFLVAHAIVLIVGLWLSREYIRWTELRPERRFLAPFLRTGAYFTAGNVLLALSQRTGEALVHLTTANFAEVGFFGAAYGAYVAGAQAVWHASLSLAPLLIGWLERGETTAVSRWLVRALLWSVAAAVAGVLIVVLAGDAAVAMLLGPAYEPVAANLVPLAVAGIALAVSSVGRLKALVVNRPGASAAAAGLELATFWVAGTWLASRFGSIGACVAVLAGASVNAGYLMWRLGGVRTTSADRSAPGAPGLRSS